MFRFANVRTLSKTGKSATDCRIMEMHVRACVCVCLSVSECVYVSIYGDILFIIKTLYLAVIKVFEIVNFLPAQSITHWSNLVTMSLCGAPDRSNNNKSLLYKTALQVSDGLQIMYLFQNRFWRWNF